MREIKFRVYDKGRKQWVHDTDHAISLFGEYVIFGEILRRPDDSIVSLDELNDLDAMQYAGLKDRNGREIYEGDVVKYLGFEVRNGKQIRPERRILADSADWIKSLHRLQCISENNSTVEVIGNIYETPELCKG